MTKTLTNDEEGARAELRRLMGLFMRCGCGGPQPSLGNSRADEHAKECHYRIEVQGGVNAGR